jgi:mannose/cellobiose epimerase-like protein (N-acyl-D-glucosamine 2-epimerase family)
MGVSENMKSPKPFVLDLGAAHVVVEMGELHEDACGMALLAERRIIIDPRKSDGQGITSTLWHEGYHHLDDLFMGRWLDKHHDKLDILANLTDMTITRNWQIFKVLYEARGKIK